jgi:hypothetical protein
MQAPEMDIESKRREVTGRGIELDDLLITTLLLLLATTANMTSFLLLVNNQPSP